jgi:ribosomal protein S18 acetylase RimI-like enzyme
MSKAMIFKLTDPSLTSQRSQIYQEIEEIFFESSARKSFSNEEERERFQWRYLGFYLTHFAECVWIAKNERVLGYCLGMPTTQGPELYKLQAHLEMFESYYSDYPAHLHINCHADARGQGLGTKLVKEFEKGMQEMGIKGIHLMTSPESRNRSFYQRLGYTFEIELSYQESPILLMGKRL